MLQSPLPGYWYGSRREAGSRGGSEEEEEERRGARQRRSLPPSRPSRSPGAKLEPGQPLKPPVRPGALRKQRLSQAVLGRWQSSVPAGALLTTVTNQTCRGHESPQDLTQSSLRGKEKARKEKKQLRSTSSCHRASAPALSSQRGPTAQMSCSATSFLNHVIPSTQG